MDLSKLDIDDLLNRAHQALAFAQALAPLGGPMAVQAVTIAKAVVEALEHLRDDADLLSDVMRAQTAEALDAFKPRLEAMEQDRQRMLNET